MRIALYSDNFYPELSGISDCSIMLARELVRRGHAVRFYVPAYAAKDYKKVGLTAENPDLGASVTFNRITSFPYPMGTGQGRVVIPTGLRGADVRRFAPDVIHTQLFFGVGVEAILAAKRLRVPLIGTNHTAIKEFLRYAPLRAEWLDNAIVRYVNWYYGQCDAVTSPAPWLLEEMKRDGFRPKGETIAIGNPLDTKMFRPLEGRGALREKFGVPENTIVHAGRLSPERRVDTMIRGVALIKKEVPDITLAIAGHGSAEGDLKKLAAELGVAENVKFVGTLDKPTLNELYNASKLFVITSGSDIQSTVMMQAMAAGLPVIGARAGGTPDFINPENGVVIPLGDEAAFARETLAMLRDEPRRARLGEGAKKYTERFLPEKIGAEWEKIYASAIARYPRDGSAKMKR